MTHTLPDFSQANVLVIGDVMLDRYWHGSTSRISPEAPVPVVNINDLEDRAGGAGNVALNIASLGAHSKLIGLIGTDDNGEQLDQLLKAQGIETHLLAQADIATITKLRIISRQQQLLRLDFEHTNQHIHSAHLQDALMQQLEQSQVLVLSDYGKGVLHAPQALIKRAKIANIPVLIDPKGTDFERYRHATLITPNLAEFEAVVGPCADDEQLVHKAQSLMQALELESILITRSEKGMTLVQQHAPAFHLPTSAREVYDVTGAGDTVIATLASCLACGLNLIDATCIANAAAGVVVGKLGTACVHPNELHKALIPQDTIAAGVHSQAQIKQIIAATRARGETLVMTNGCFDLLHPGHIQYLQEAKQLGDHLLVAVNSDHSVRRLKGKERPINDLNTRMSMLCALKSVDWVTAFEQDTPEALIQDLLPDVLVKGGDYQIDAIAGAEAVLQAGGEVKVLTFKDNHSSTALINKIKEIKP